MQQTSGVLSFDYLRPPQEVLGSIKHDKEYIKKGKRSKSQRRIWETVPYDEYEQEKMGDCLKEVQKQGIQLPAEYQITITPILVGDQAILLGFATFPSSRAATISKSHQEPEEPSHMESESSVPYAYRSECSFFGNPSKIQLIQNTGVIYTIGRDRQWRPIIIMNLELVNLSQFNEEAYINAMSFFFGLVKNNTFVPGIIENWVFIMDTKKLGLTQFPFKVLGSAISTMQTNFCGCLDKLFILDPSSSLSFSWKIISSMCDPDSISKVSFLKPKEYAKMQERIAPNQLEQQYGGTAPNLSRFWPPINLEIPGGYPPEVLQKVDELHVGKLEIQKETPVAEEDEAKLQQQLQNLKIPQQDEGDDDSSPSK